MNRNDGISIGGSVSLTNSAMAGGHGAHAVSRTTSTAVGSSWQDVRADLARLQHYLTSTQPSAGTAEVRETVQLARAESEKGHPNRNLLLGLMAAVRSAIAPATQLVELVDRIAATVNALR